MKELGTERACIALGYFDSVHLGHRKLIDVARAKAKELGAVCAVTTFFNNAYKMFNADDKQVYTYSERCELLGKLCDAIVPMRFDTRLKNCSARTFLDIFTSRHNVAAFVCGYDYTFGAGAKGDRSFLREYCDSKGIELIVVDKYEVDGERISTTAVKSLLIAGDVEKAGVFLGEPFMLCGRVMHGRGAGRMFDIPTANLKFPSSKLLPKSGVYGASCVIGANEFWGAVNVGGRPTFGLSKSVVEVMLDNFNDNIYEKDIKIVFRKYLRPTSKFDTPSQLSKQVHNDIGWYKQ